MPWHPRRKTRRYRASTRRRPRLATPTSRRLQLEPLEARHMLSITVNTPIDELDGSVLDGDVSLRDALLAATPFETIDFAPALTSAGPVTINLILGELRITKDVVINGPGSGLLTISAIGNDPTPALNNGDGSRIFSVNNGSGTTNIDVKISGLTLVNGDALLDGGAIRNFENLTVNDVRLTDNSTRHHGGGIFSTASVTLINSHVSGNVAAGKGGGIFNSGLYLTVQGSNITSNEATDGGGIANSAAGNYLIVNDSYISGNHVSGNGGGILQGNGNLRLTNSAVYYNRAQLSGGGIDSTATNLVISNSSLFNNRAYGGDGAGLRADASPATITGTAFNSNSAVGNGAGIWSRGGTLTLIDDFFGSNNATGTGGAIYTDALGVDVTRASVVNNTANSGGGIASHAGVLILHESTISGNHANADGGGILADASNLSVFSSTISGNTAVNDGGAIWLNALAGASVGIHNSTITQNAARSAGAGFGAGGGIIGTPSTIINLSHTILAGNSRAGTPDDLYGKAYIAYSLLGVDSGAILNNVGGNLIGTAAAPIDPLLAPLDSNGGPTATHLPLPGSPVIDAGDPLANGGNGPQFDQRGAPFARIRNGAGFDEARIDIGAIEVQPGSIHGQKWNDANRNGIKDPNETGLAGWTIYLDANGNGEFDSHQNAIEPDDYPQGTLLNNVHPGAVLSALVPGLPISSSPGLASTGGLVISSIFSLTWGESVPLRVDFTNPTNYVSIDAVADSFFDFAHLLAFDVNNNLLATYDTAAFTVFGQAETMSIARASSDIAYVLASGSLGNSIYLDNLRFGTSEPSTTTDADGNYAFLDLPPGEYIVGEVPQPGWEQTFPTSLAATLENLNANNAAISALVPTRYDFFEGLTGDSIFDGGDDMYDGGNFLSTDLASTTIPYSAGFLTSGDSAFGPGSQYFTNKYPGLFVLGATNTSINSFQIAGNNGADSDGFVFGETLSTVVNGRQYTIYVKRVYNAGDPSINHIIMVPGNGSGKSHGFSSDTNDDDDLLTGLSSVDEIYYALVARQNGAYLDSADVLNIANAFLANLSSDTAGHTVTVHSGEIVAGIDFGNHALPGSISGQKWHDLNGDGVKDPGEPGLEGWTVYLDQNNNGVFDTGIHTSYESTDVPQTAQLSTVFSQLVINDPLAVIQDLDVTLNISHTWDNDAQVFLTSPAGTRVQLFVGVGSSGDNFIDTILDDEATITITRAGAPFTGSFRPQQPLSAFDGQAPSGIWTLEFTDIVLADSGTLNSWSLGITTTEPSATTDAEGNYAFSGLAAGNYVVGEVQPEGWRQTLPGAPNATGLIVNGGFETGDFFGWSIEDLGSGNFVINNGTFDPNSNDGPMPPFSGAYSALSNQTGPGTHVLYQDVTIPAGSHLTLQWVDQIRNHPSLFVDPNQEYRVEIRDTAGSVLTTLYSTNPGDSPFQDWTPRNADLSAFAGQTIRIAFVEQDNIGFFNVHIDDVQIFGANGVGTIAVSLSPGQTNSGNDFGNQLLLPGDYNLNGVVDAADYTNWADTRGHLIPSFRGADGNGNGIIDVDDYSFWKSHFGNVLPLAGSGAVAPAVADESLASAQPSAQLGYGLPKQTVPAAGTQTVLPPAASRSTPRDETLPRLVRTNLSSPAERRDDLLATWQSTRSFQYPHQAFDSIFSERANNSTDDEIDAIDNAFATLELALAQ